MTKETYHYEEDPCGIGAPTADVYSTMSVPFESYTPTQPNPGPNNFEWRIPEFKDKLIVQILDVNGELVSEMIVSDFIMIKPGQLIRGLAE